MKNPCSKMVQRHKHNHPSSGFSHTTELVRVFLIRKEWCLYFFRAPATTAVLCPWHVLAAASASAAPRSFYCAISALRTTCPTCSVGGAIPLNKLRHSQRHFRRLAITYTTVLIPLAILRYTCSHTTQPVRWCNPIEQVVSHCGLMTTPLTLLTLLTHLTLL